MNTRNLMRKLPSCLLGAIFVFGVASTTMVSAVDGDPPGLFELEGNPEGEGTPGDDWEVLYNFGGNDGGSPFAFTGIVPDIATADVGDRVFTQGGSKDVSDVDQWKYTTGSTPDKNEITNAYAAAYNNPTDVCVTAGVAGECAEGQTPVHEAGDLIVYFGLDRFANDGDALAGFWFFQGDVSLTEPSSQGTGDFIGNHVAMRDNPDFGLPGEPEFLPGDMFIIVNYPQGANAQPEIKVYQWDPNDADGDVNFDPSEQTKPPKNLSSPLDLVFADAQALCDGAGDKLACAITNPADILNSPEWEYTPKSGLATTLPHESLFEGGINVTALLGTTPCFASFLAETRSSTSQTAQLKDFVFGAFPVCGIEVAKDCTADLNDNGDGVDVSFFGTLENTGGSGFIAYLKDDQAGASIDDVCIDTGAAGCGDDDPVAGLVLQADGSAYFPLPPNTTVRYEGSYSVSELPADFTMTDEVMALAFTDIEDVPASGAEPNLALVVVDDTAGAECTFNVNADLEVVKNCTVAFLGGNSAEVTISGTVENTGDVPLSNVVVEDSVFGLLTFPGTLAVGEVQPFEVTQPVDYADLAPTTSAPDANGVVTVTLNHSDTVTASGDALAADDSVLDSAEHSDSATCDDTYTRGVDVAKDCDVFLDYDDTTGRIVIRVDVSATVTNLGEETLSNIVLTDVPAVTFSGALSSLASGEDFTATGSYYPSTTDGGNVATGPEASFTDEVTVTADGAFDGVEASDENTATCDLCF